MTHINDSFVLAQKITDLKPGTTYNFRIMAENAAGRSNWSEWLNITTEKARKYNSNPNIEILSI